MDGEQLARLQEYNARRWMRARARYLCNGEHGRSKLDPVYEAVTEGRDAQAMWPHYSSCGDLSQALAFELGCRGPWVNRAEAHGWRSGQNLLAFYTGEGPAVTPDEDYEPDAGDIGFIWLLGNDAHTFVFGDRLDDTHVETFNYGAAGMSAAAFPGAHESHSQVQRGTDGLWHVGSRLLHKVCTVPALLAAVDSDFLPDLSAEAIETLEGLVP